MQALLANQLRIQVYKLDNDIYHLLKDEPYFTLLSRQLNKQAVDTISTAGIRFNADRLSYELVYNPTFMESLEPKHKKWVLMHELYHASFGHLEGRTQEGMDRQSANCAMDLAINSLSNMTQDAPDFVLMPGRGEFKFIHLFGQATEWYANLIQKEKKENPDQIGDTEPFDDHSEFGGDNKEGKQIAQKKLEDAIAKAANECDKGDGKGGHPKGWGSVSSVTSKQIRDSVNRFKLDPKKVLTSFIKASVAADKKTSVTKRNRRLPGKKFGRRVQLGLATLQSLLALQWSHLITRYLRIKCMYGKKEKRGRRSVFYMVVHVLTHPQSLLMREFLMVTLSLPT